jgi:protease PrsW
MLTGNDCIIAYNGALNLKDGLRISRLLSRQRPTLIAAQEAKRRAPEARPVFRTAIVEVLLLVAITGGIVLINRFIGLQLNTSSRIAAGLGMALLPLLLYLMVSFQGERRAQRKRPQLLIVLGLSMLAANGIGVPLVERVFAVDSWLSTTSGLQRIIGYALTAGFIQEFLKLAVVRFSVWGEYIRTRRDGVAYSLAASLGYATVLSLNYILAETNNPPDLAAAALRVAGYTLSQLAIGTICGYTLADLRVGQPSVLWLPLGLAVAALLEGIFVSVRAGIIVGGFSERATGSQTAASLGIAIALVFGLFLVINFLISTTDSRERRSPEFNR